MYIIAARQARAVDPPRKLSNDIVRRSAEAFIVTRRRCWNY